jgi:hypothetical protein
LASIINSTDTGSGGLITTGDSSDELQIQTAETTAITITSGQQSVFIAGTAAAPAVTTTGDLNTGIFFSAADTLVVTTGGTAAVTVDSGQRTKFPTTIGVGGATPSASGSGISFPATQSASSNVNTLDDYEEGTWTPTSSTGGWTFSIDDAQYVKIGKQVSVWASISNTGSGNGSQIVIGGLPFSVPANCYAVSVFDTGGNSKTGSYIRANSGGTLAYAWYVSTSRQSLLGTDISGSSYILFNWTYFV